VSITDHGRRDRVGERLVISALQNGPAGAQHLLAVAGEPGRRSPGRQQMDVAFSGDVEGMAAVAAQGSVHGFEAAGA
jgi:hypothetical protein